MPIYMKYGELAGDVTTTGFEGWIEIDSFSWGASRAVTAPGASGGGSAGKVSISDINITKPLDKASVPLLQSASVGEATNAVTLVFLKTFKQSVAFLKDSVPYLKYQLNDALVSSYSISSGGDRPEESLSLNFAKIVTTYTPQNGQSETVEIDETTDTVS